MKLLTKLRNLTAFTMPAEPEHEELASLLLPHINTELFQETEEEYAFGIGAVMPQDVTGMHFLDGLRLRIPEIHEELP